jgi:hypothetical protein
MATTVTPVISNSIGLASRYLPILDEIYKRAAITGVLDTAEDRVRFDEQYHTFYLFETEMVGLADYSRNDGFVRGDVVSQWRPYAPQWDRGRQFLVDVLDNSESLSMSFGTLAGEFMRTQVVPETDAVRFATYANGAYSGNKKAETISTAADAVEAIDYATAVLDDEEVPYEGRVLYVNPWYYKLIKGGIEHLVENGDRDVDYNVERYNNMRIITAPSGRFNTEITLAQPTAHDGAGGYTATGSTINFMIIHPSAVMQAVEMAEPRIFSPRENQQARAWMYDFRQYHGAWVKHNKTQGIYVSAPSMPSA